MRQRIYIASDMHFGAGTHASNLQREQHFVRWLDSICDHCRELYLLGDVFDFWFEYKHAVPKGHVRLLGKLAELADDGVDIHIFTGNHDLWLRDYFPHEIGATVHTEPVIREWYGKTFYLAHGDGLGPGDYAYKSVKKIFTNRLAKWLFRWLHPDLGIGLAHLASRISNRHDYENPDHCEEVNLKGQKEWLYIHSKEVLQKDPGIQYFVYGHRHALINDNLTDESRIILLGDWIQYFSYLEISEAEMGLGVFPMKQGVSRLS